MPYDNASKLLIVAASGVLITGLGIGLSWYLYEQKKNAKSRSQSTPEADAAFKKLRLRAIERYEKRSKEGLDVSSDNLAQIVDLETPELIQQYFMQQVTLGEKKVEEQNFDVAAEHFTNAVIVCLEQKQLMITLKQTLHPEVFRMLQIKLNAVNAAFQQQQQLQQQPQPQQQQQ